jgi:hypothetical protein
MYDENENKTICDALKQVGIPVNSIYDLVNSSAAYPKAIPILLKMLNEVKSDRMVEGLARALTVKEARGIAGKPLIMIFQSYKPENPSQETVKWAIGNAISFVVDQMDFDKLIQLAKDKEHGSARRMLPRALARINDARRVNLLIEFLNDEDLLRESLWALGKLKVKGAEKQIEQFLDHPDKPIRDEAKRALDKIIANF